MSRRANAAILVCGCLFAPSAFADSHDDHARPCRLEVGVNTRHWQPAADNSRIAFRTMEPPDVALQANTAVSTSFRFTGVTRYNMFFGGEGEAGALVGRAGSNLAGAYAVAGARGDLGKVQLAAELVAGRRWVRYALDGTGDQAMMIAEPRVRGDIWLAPRWTLGGAVGATLSERNVWMVGIYLGLHSSEYGKW